MEDRLLKVDEVVARTGLSRHTVYKWAEIGKLPSVHIGRALRLRESEIQRIVEHGLEGGA